MFAPHELPLWLPHAPDEKQGPDVVAVRIGEDTSNFAKLHRQKGRSYRIIFFPTDMPSFVAIEGETATRYVFDIYHRIVRRKRQCLTDTRPYR
jgi:hypothetical protein